MTVKKGEIDIDPPVDQFGTDWYTVELYAGNVYVVIEDGVVKIINSPREYSSRIACIVDSESGKIEQIASSTITLLIEEDSPDAPESEDPSGAPPCGHPGNEPGAGGDSGGGDDTEHPGDDPGAGGNSSGDDTDHPGDSPSPPSSGDCE
jgi:hypothetical protein